MKVDIEQVKKLRAATGVGLTDAKKALEDANGDYEKAVKAMRVKGIAKAEKKADRTASSGLVHAYIHGGKIGVLVEVNCETDFVARTDDFKEFANNIALHVAASNPHYVSSEDVPSDVVEKERELVHAELKEQGKPEDMFDKIAEGKLKKFTAEMSLLEQPFVKNPDQTVNDYLKETVAKLGENIIIRRFRRLELGADNE